MVLYTRNDRTLEVPRIFVSHSERETVRLASEFAKTLRGGEVVLLDGDLGAGKTVFARGLAKGLGIRGRITSPTFVLMRIHRANSRQPIAGSIRHRSSMAIGYRLPAIGFLVHVDAYRIRDPHELIAIGLLEWVGRPDAVVVIEWGERVRNMLDRKIRVYGVAMQPFDVHDRSQRNIVVTTVSSP